MVCPGKFGKSQHKDSEALPCREGCFLNRTSVCFGFPGFYCYDCGRGERILYINPLGYRSISDIIGAYGDNEENEYSIRCRNAIRAGS